MPKQTRRARKDKFEDQRQDNTPVLVPKNEIQREYIKALYENKLIIAEGPSGVGKTLIPSHKAGEWLQKGEIDKIILARPYVTMGRTAGFRPGTTYDKLYPYLRSMLTTIQKVVGTNYQYLLEKEIIEIQALEDIRGRSFDENCICIVDEFQNSTPDEAKSIVTRIGSGCKLVLCGDQAQTDLKGKTGLEFIKEIVDVYNIPDVATVQFTSDDIVRSDMVKRFVMAFEREAGRDNASF